MKPQDITITQEQKDQLMQEINDTIAATTKYRDFLDTVWTNTFNAYKYKIESAKNLDNLYSAMQGLEKIIKKELQANTIRTVVLDKNGKVVRDEKGNVKLEEKSGLIDPTTRKKIKLAETDYTNTDINYALERSNYLREFFLYIIDCKKWWKDYIDNIDANKKQIEENNKNKVTNKRRASLTPEQLSEEPPTPLEIDTGVYFNRQLISTEKSDDFNPKPVPPILEPEPPKHPKEFPVPEPETKKKGVPAEKKVAIEENKPVPHVEPGTPPTGVLPAPPEKRPEDERLAAPGTPGIITAKENLKKTAEDSISTITGQNISDAIPSTGIDWDQLQKLAQGKGILKNEDINSFQAGKLNYEKNLSDERIKEEITKFLALGITGVTLAALVVALFGSGAAALIPVTIEELTAITAGAAATGLVTPALGDSIPPPEPEQPAIKKHTPGQDYEEMNLSDYKEPVQKEVEGVDYGEDWLIAHTPAAVTGEYIDSVIKEINSNLEAVQKEKARLDSLYKDTILYFIRAKDKLGIPQNPEDLKGIIQLETSKENTPNMGLLSPDDTQFKFLKLREELENSRKNSNLYNPLSDDPFLKNSSTPSPEPFSFVPPNDEPNVNRVMPQQTSNFGKEPFSEAYASNKTTNYLYSTLHELTQSLYNLTKSTPLAENTAKSYATAGQNVLNNYMNTLSSNSGINPAFSHNFGTTNSESYFIRVIKEASIPGALA